MAGWQESDAPLSLAEDDGERLVEALLVLADFALAVRLVRADLRAGRPRRAERLLTDALAEINRWVCVRLQGATVH